MRLRPFILGGVILALGVTVFFGIKHYKNATPKHRIISIYDQNGELLSNEPFDGLKQCVKKTMQCIDTSNGDPYTDPVAISYLSHIYNIIDRHTYKNKTEFHTFFSLEITNRIKKYLSFDKSNQKDIADISIVVLDTKTGAVLSIINNQGALKNNFKQHIIPHPSGTMLWPLIYLNIFEKDYGPITIFQNDKTNLEKNKIWESPLFYTAPIDKIMSLRKGFGNFLPISIDKTYKFINKNQFYKTLMFFDIKKDINTETTIRDIITGTATIDLLRLTQIYHSLGNLGQNTELKWLNKIIQNSETGENNTIPITSKKTEIIPFYEYQAFLVNDILGDLRNKIFYQSKTKKEETSYPSIVHSDIINQTAWSIGFTPDFTVGVLISCPNRTCLNTSIDLWRKIMDEIMNKKNIKNFPIPNNLEKKQVCYKNNCWSDWFIKGQKYIKSLDPIIEQNDLTFSHILPNEKLILSPQENEIIYYNSNLTDKKQTIPLICSATSHPNTSECIWKIDNIEIGQGSSINWDLKLGRHEILVQNNQKKEKIIIYVIESNIL